MSRFRYSQKNMCFFKDVLQLFFSHLLFHSEPTRRGTLLFDNYKVPGCCLPSPCIMLYSTAAYLNTSQPACVRHIVVTPYNQQWVRKEDAVSHSCLFIEESTNNLRMLNIILYLQCKYCHCAKGEMLYPVLLYITQHLIVFPIQQLLFSLTTSLI